MKKISIQTIRHNEFKFRNNDGEFLAVHLALHRVASSHFTNFRFQITARNIFVNISGFKNRLLSYYAFSFYLCNRTTGIINNPMPCKQLDSMIASVFNTNFIGKGIMQLLGIGIFGVV